MYPRALPLGVYIPGSSWIHRLPAGVKFWALCGFIVFTTFAISSPVAAAAALLLASCGLVIARIPLAVAWGQLWPPLLIMIPLAGFQLWQQGPRTALVVFLSIYANLIAAILLTLTTTISELMDGLERTLAPLGRLGVPVGHLSLAMSLTLRLIPLMLGTIAEVHDARKARGYGASPIAFATPVMIRSLRRAHALAEALAARGVGDGEELRRHKR